MSNPIETMVSESAEATVVATALKHPDFTLHSEMLKPAYFYHSENGCWMWAIEELYKQGITNIDVLNLTNVIQSNKAVAKVMETKGLTDIKQYIELSSIAARDTIEEYMLAVKEVLTMAYKRDLYKSLNGLTKDCTNAEIDLKTLEKKLRGDINKVTEKYIIDDDMHSSGEDIEDIWEQIEEDRNTDGSYGIPTIFPTLTEHGLVHEKGEMILLCAKRKVGKSLLLLNEFSNKLKLGMSCLYHDTEMSDKLFTIRLLANLTGVPQALIKSGGYSKAEEKKIVEAIEWLKKQKYKHIYAPNFNETEIYNQYRIFMYRYGENMMGFYDYFKATGSDSSMNYNQLGSQANFMKNEIAGGLQIPVMAAAQLNRDGAIADSFRLEMIASAGLSYREKTSEEIMNDGGLDAGNYRLHLDFARSAEPMGEDEFVNIAVDGSRMRIQEAQKQPVKHSPFDKEGDDSDNN